MATNISSLHNPRVKSAIKLRNRHHRDREGLTLLEGYRAISRAHACRMPIKTCYFCPELFLGENESDLLEKLNSTGTECIQVSPPVLRKMAYRDRPEGLIAIAPAKKHPLADLKPTPQGLYLVAEAIEKPGNLGSMLRSADAAAVNALILCDPCTDVYNPNVITASTGTVFSVPIAIAESSETAVWLEKHRIQTIATTPHTDRIYTDTDLTGPTAIIVGTEQYGLSDFWLAKTDVQVRIPMLGLADSLNVAAATTILLFEAARQRGFQP